MRLDTLFNAKAPVGHQAKTQVWTSGWFLDYTNTKFDVFDYKFDGFLKILATLFSYCLEKMDYTDEYKIQ